MAGTNELEAAIAWLTNNGYNPQVNLLGEILVYEKRLDQIFLTELAKKQNRKEPDVNALKKQLGIE